MLAQDWRHMPKPRASQRSLFCANVMATGGLPARQPLLPPLVERLHACCELSPGVLSQHCAAMFARPTRVVDGSVMHVLAGNLLLPPSSTLTGENAVVGNDVGEGVVGEGVGEGVVGEGVVGEGVGEGVGSAGVPGPGSAVSGGLPSGLPSPDSGTSASSARASERNAAALTLLTGPSVAVKAAMSTLGSGVTAEVGARVAVGGRDDGVGVDAGVGAGVVGAGVDAGVGAGVVVGGEGDGALPLTRKVVDSRLPSPDMLPRTSVAPDSVSV